MKTSISLWCFHKLLENDRITVEEYIDFCAALGVDGIEIVSFLLKDKDVQIPAMLEQMKRRGLGLASYSIASDFAKTTAEERAMMIENVKREIDYAQKAGAEVVRVFSSDFGNGVSYEQAKKWIVESLREVAAYAKTKGIMLGLENHGYYSGTSEHILDVLRMVGEDNLKVTLDIGNFILVDEDHMQAITNLKHQAILVHFKDFHEVPEDFPEKAYKANSGRRFVGAVVGTGIINAKHAMKELESVNYNGYLTIEYDGNEDDTRPQIEKAIKNLKALLGK